jgi:ribosomal protein L37AE/L43A
MIGVNDRINEFTGATARHTCSLCKLRRLFFLVATESGGYLCLECGQHAAGPLYRWSIARQKYEEVSRCTNGLSH